MTLPQVPALLSEPEDQSGDDDDCSSWRPRRFKYERGRPPEWMSPHAFLVHAVRVMTMHSE